MLGSSLVNSLENLYDVYSTDLGVSLSNEVNYLNFNFKDNFNVNCGQILI